jgi:6-pyruvoyltetrahydropterin/6-carboxytetrahydropterin synthase
MAKERVVLNSDLKYIDRGNLLRSRSELSVAKMLSFLTHKYKYDVNVRMPDGESLKIDFKIGGNKYIEVLDSEEDAIKF